MKVRSVFSAPFSSRSEDFNRATGSKNRTATATATATPEIVAANDHNSTAANRWRQSNRDRTATPTRSRLARGYTARRDFPGISRSPLRFEARSLSFAYLARLPCRLRSSRSFVAVFVPRATLSVRLKTTASGASRQSASGVVNSSGDTGWRSVPCKILSKL